MTIIVDTNETEKNYFNGLKDTLSNGTQISILRAKKTETIVEFALDYKNGANLPTAEIWLVFDRDELRIFDRLIEQAERHALKVAWSNPCFEIWLHAHLGEMPACNES